MTAVPFWEEDGGSATQGDPANKDRRNVWDRVILGGVTMPGAATVDVKQSRKIDDKGSPGRNGARLVDKGSDAATVSIRLRIWTPKQLDELAASFPSLNFKSERYTTRRTLSLDERLQGLNTTGDEAVATAALGAQGTGAAPPGLGAFVGTLAVAEALSRSTVRESHTRRVRRPVSISHPSTTLAGITCVYVKELQLQGPNDGVLELRIECLEYVAEANRRSATRAPRPAGDFTRRTAFDAPGSQSPAPNTPQAPPSRGNAGP